MRASTVVIGGGVTGLAAATLAAAQGRDVVLFDKATSLGGRAKSRTMDGYVFNEGAHALYLGGPAAAVLKSLGVAWTGKEPSVRRALALADGKRHRLPTGLASLASTTLLPAIAKVEAARWLARLGAIDAGKIDDTPLEAWLDSTFRHDATRALVRMLARLSTFDGTPGMSAGAAVRALRLAGKGVHYLDGGWETLVVGLRGAANRAGVRTITGARVVAIEHDECVQSVRLEDGTALAASEVIVATSPRTLDRLVGGKISEIARYAETLRPVRVACLDLALTRLPDPRVTFAIGCDAPTYFSVHSSASELAPEGGALVHTMKYLGEGSARDAEAELEALMDTLQSGRRELVVHRRTLPQITVMHAAPDASLGGTRDRPSPRVPGVAGLFVAGDWVGSEGLLLDACLASARSVAKMLSPEVLARAV